LVRTLVSTLGLHSTANMKNPLSGQALSEPFSVLVRQSPSGGRLPSVRPQTQCCAIAGCQRGKGCSTNVACDFSANPF
jgi:hypothetical protein